MYTPSSGSVITRGRVEYISPREYLPVFLIIIYIIIYIYNNYVKIAIISLSGITKRGRVLREIEFPLRCIKVNVQNTYFYVYVL